MMFYLLLLIGIVKPQDMGLYAYFVDDKVFEYATKEEIECAIQTNEFYYFNNPNLESYD